LLDAGLNHPVKADLCPIGLELVKKESLAVFEFLDLSPLGGDFAFDNPAELFFVESCFVVIKSDNHLVVFRLLVDVDEGDGCVGVAEFNSRNDNGWEFFERLKADDDPVKDFVAGVFFLEKFDS